MATFPPLLGLLVAISGASSLIYELLWIRALGLHFGTTTPAITTVVATFMLGLGLGNVLFGARADRSTRPFVLYARIELSIALSAFLVSLLLWRGGAWLDRLARLCAFDGPLATPAMACVLAVLMLAPTTAMGATLPVLARALSQREQPGRALALLYACNTFGAIAGALLPDFALIPRFGMTFTAGIAAAGNLIVAIVVFGVFRREPESRSESFGVVWRIGLSRSQIGAIVISAGSGFCSLGLEVLWSRTLQNWAAALVTSFAVLLGVYLTALSLGALTTQRIAAVNRRPLGLASLLLGITALCVLTPISLSVRWRDLERAFWPRPIGFRRLGLWREAIDALFHASYLETTACACLGAVFPFVAATWLRDGKPGARTGQLFLVNTFSGVIGASIVGFVWLPALGEQDCYCALACMLGAVAVLASWIAPPTERHRAMSTFTLVCFVAVLSWTLLLPGQVLFRAHFRSGGHVIAVEEGVTTTAAVAERFVYGEPYYRELLTPGISMSSTRADARRYMAVMAHTAMLSARGAERALLICYGVGNTASALLSHRRLERLDVVDISPEVLALAPKFAAVRGDNPLDDRRSHVFVDDGRHHLITHDAHYDVITTEPPPPNYAGVVNLYSREFYQLAKRRLAAGGVITQWLPVFQLADSDVRAMIAAFVSELPHTALLYGYEQQWVLIGSLEPLAVASSAALRLDRDAAFVDRLRRDDIGGVEDLLGSVLQTDAELRRSVVGVTPLSDERPTIQYPFESVRDDRIYTRHLVNDRDRHASLLAGESIAALERRVTRAENATSRTLSSLPLLGLEPPEGRELALGRRLQPALDARPDDEGLRGLLSIDRDRVELAERALGRPGADEMLARRQAELPRYLVLQDALWVLARRAFYAHDYARALAIFARIAPSRGDAALHALLVGGCLRGSGQFAAATDAFRAAAAVSGDVTFRAAAAALSAHAERSFSQTAGPWSLDE